MDRNFKNLESMYAITTIWYFLECCSSRVPMNVRLWAFINFLEVFFMLLSIQLFCYIFPDSIFYPEIILFLLHLFAWFSFCTLNQLMEFSFFILECPVLFVLLDPIQEHFEPPFFLPISLILFLPIGLSDLSLVFFWGSFHFVGFLWVLSSLVVS